MRLLGFLLPSDSACAPYGPLWRLLDDLEGDTTHGEMTPVNGLSMMTGGLDAKDGERLKLAMERYTGRRTSRYTTTSRPCCPICESLRGRCSGRSEAVLSHCTHTGTVRPLVVPSPNWPKPLSPQVHTVPSERTAIEW